MAVEYSNISSITNFFGNQKESNYIIYRGLKCTYKFDEYHGNNKEDAELQLENFLKNVNNSNEYVLQIVGGKTSKETLPSCIFKLEEKPERQNVSGYYNNNSEVLTRLASIENNIANIHTDTEDDYIEEPKNFLGQILEEPGFKEMIISGIGSLIANFMQPKIEDKAILAGIETGNVDDYLKVLFANGLTENDLFLLSKKSKVELNYLLKMLRK